MGSDYDSQYAIIAARKFLKNHPDIEITLCGQEENIKKYITPSDKFVILHASNVIHTQDSFASMMRNSESSIYKSLTLLNKDQYDGMITAGTTAAVVLLGNFIIKPIQGINKAAFMSYVPKANKEPFMFLDVGANLECSAEDLVQFAKMGNIYSNSINKVEKPKVYILNIGTEDNKGFPAHQQAHTILKQQSSINYCGFIESRYLLTSDADVIVCDGFSGNIALKAIEGGLMSLNTVLKHEFKKPWNFLGALLSLSVFKNIKKIFDYKKNAAAFIAGLNKNVVKTHGSAKDEEWYSAMEKLYIAINIDLKSIISKNI